MAEKQATNPRVVPTESVYDDVVDVVVDDVDDQQTKNTASDVAITAALSKLSVGNAAGPTVPPDDIPDCAVCLQRCIHPVKLPCNHVFCFLCVKGVAMQSGRCALCRKQITAEFFNNPTVLSDDKETTAERGEEEQATRPDLYAWFYEGRNGWWQYEERTNVELEESYRKKLRTFELLIAGFVYTIDLDNMVQMRRSDPSRRRRIKRDLVSAPKKGIAGLKFAQQQQKTDVASAGAGREVLGGECEKNDQVSTSGNRSSPTNRPTRRTSDDIGARQVTQLEDEGASASVEHRTSSTTTDDTAYEVLPQPHGSGSDKITNYDQSSNRPNSSRTNSANNSSRRPKPKPRAHIRGTVPQHPSSYVSSSSSQAADNDSFGLVVPQQPTSSSSSHHHVSGAANETYGLVMHHQQPGRAPKPSEGTGQSQSTSDLDRDDGTDIDTTSVADDGSQRHVRRRRNQSHFSDL